MSFVQSETFITDYVVTGAVEFPGNIGGMTAAATRRRSLIELCLVIYEARMVLSFAGFPDLNQASGWGVSPRGASIVKRRADAKPLAEYAAETAGGHLNRFASHLRNNRYEPKRQKCLSRRYDRTDERSVSFCCVVVSASTRPNESGLKGIATAVRGSGGRFCQMQSASDNL